MGLPTGCKQVVQGVTVDHITAPYPLINIAEAVKEVKAADPGNQGLQNLRIPYMLLVVKQIYSLEFFTKVVILFI